MPNTVIYNPLLKKGFQEVNDASAEIDDLKQHKITKCKTVADLTNLDDGEIFQWQGPDNVENNLKNGFFYNTSGQVTIPIGTPFIEIPADIVGEFSTIKAGKYYNTGHQSVTMLGYRTCTDTNNNTYRYFHFGAQADMPRVGDSFISPAFTYSETTTYYTIASVSWVTGNTYDITLNNGDALTVTVNSSGGSYAILQEFENNDGKIYLYNYNPYTSFNPVLFADTENNNAVIYAPFITNGTTDEEVIITAGFAQIDTQPGINSISNDEGGGVAISTDVTIAGNLTVQGTQTVVQTQEIDSESDNINLRYNNPLALADGEESGVKVLNYDGNNTNCFLGVDNEGWARVGDEGGTLQKLATIEESPTDGAFATYNATDKELQTTTDGSKLNVTFTDAAVSGNISSGETLEVMAKKINQNFKQSTILNADFWQQVETKYTAAANWSMLSFGTAVGSEGAFFGWKRSNSYAVSAFGIIVSFDNCYIAWRQSNGWNYKKLISSFEILQNNINS